MSEVDIHRFMTINSIAFRSPWKRFVKWLLDVEAENIDHSSYYERKIDSLY